jgi:glutamine---fructose-6-phosphate transaminase (isomerizing)
MGNSWTKNCKKKKILFFQDINAHPHLDYKKRIALIHNGVIENHDILKKRLTKHGIPFVSETDSEVIVQYISWRIDEGESLKEAIQHTLKLLEGTWGLVIFSTLEPDRIYACRNGSPILIGMSKGKTFLASEGDAFNRHTREMIALENGEIAIVTADGLQEIIGKGKDVQSRILLAEEEKIQLSPDPYPHWTIKEIMEQPSSISRALNFGGRISSSSEVRLGGLQDNIEWLEKIEHLVIAGCGTSFYAGLYGATLMKQLKCFETVQVIDAAELDECDFPSSSKNVGILVISQSGETADVVRCLDIAEKLSIPSLSVVNKVGSLIARTTACGVYVNAGKEVAVASTKAFTSQVTSLALISIWFSSLKSRDKVHNTTQQRKQLVSALHRLPTCVGMLLNTIQDDCRRIAKKLLNHTTLFVLGKGFGDCIGKEGSLKIKEITYTHAESYASGALKHGPFALIDKGTPIFMIILDDEHKSLNMNAAAQVKSRGADIYIISDCDPERFQSQGICDDIIQIPSNGSLTALIGVIPLQLIAYELSILKGINPDKPKNLAKTVTVK